MALAALLALKLGACDERSSSPSLGVLCFDTIPTTDTELWGAAYSSPKYPSDFYVEDRQGGSIYYENSLSVKPLHEREASSIPLCTEDPAQASAWSEASAINYAHYRDSTDWRETEKYYEIKRVYAERPTDIVLSRVHKCSYLDRSCYDSYQHGDTLGVFNHRPVTPESVKELLEYLWFTSTYNHGGLNVAHSSGRNVGEKIQHDIYAVEVVFGDYGVYDRISLIQYEYLVDTNSGTIWLSSETTLRAMDGIRR
jgi:hypothetical protein